MTLGASAMAAAAPAVIARLAFAMNLRRSMFTLRSSPFFFPSRRDELVVGALGHVVPGAQHGLEPREGRVHFPGDRGLLRLFPDDLDGQFLEIAQHRDGKLEHFDLALELYLEP